MASDLVNRSPKGRTEQEVTLPASYRSSSFRDPMQRRFVKWEQRGVGNDSGVWTGSSQSNNEMLCSKLGNEIASLVLKKAASKHSMSTMDDAVRCRALEERRCGCIVKSSQ